MRVAALDTGTMDAGTMNDRTLVLERSFRASPARVYAAWTDPEALPRWFGPDSLSCRTHAIDVREGGVWRFDMTGEGQLFANRHRWTTLVPHRRIEFLMDDGSDDRPPMIVQVTLSPEGAGTRLVQRVTFPDAAGRAAAEGYGAVEKGHQTLTKLAASLGE